MSLSRRVLAATFGLLLPVSSLWASQAETPPAPAGPPEITLSLADAVRMGLENNLDVRISSKTPLIREQDVLIQSAVFDPNLRFFAEKQDNTFASAQRTVLGVGGATQVQSSEDIVGPFNIRQNNFIAAFGDPLRWGGRYSAELDLSREITSSADSFLPKQYQTALLLAYEQSLLRNFGYEANETQIVLAQNNFDLSRSQYRNQVQVSLKQIEDAYWELVFARQDLDVKKESLRLAEELLKLNRIKVQVGTLPPIEITTAEAEVANREQAVIVSENAVRDAEDTLRQAVNMPKGDDAWGRGILPTDQPNYVERPVDLEKELQEAVSHRPDLEQARIDIKSADTRLSFDKNQRKWDLAFRASYTLYGLAGDNPTVFTDPNGVVLVATFDEDFGDSLRRISDRDFDSWGVLLNLNIPIGNNAANAAYVGSRIAKEQTEITYEKTRLNAEVQVRTAARAIVTGKKRIDAAEKNVELQRKKVEAEQKKFENGMSTSFQVLEFQEDLTTALGTLNRALVDYRKALTALEQSKGTLDQYLNVTLQ